MKEVAAEPRIESLTVTIPPARDNIGRMIGVICGLSLAGIGVIMMISIVLFIPGIFGVLIGLVTHTFRHTFAKMSVRNGANLFDLQKILGHTTLDMVRVYVNLFSNEVAEAHRKFSPIENLHMPD